MACCLLLSCVCLLHLIDPRPLGWPHQGANVMSWDSGWPPVRKFSRQELNAWCITKHCGIADADLVKMNLFEERELHLPAYILTVDHATKSVVLSVRGTFSMQDTVTDLVCDSAGERAGW